MVRLVKIEEILSAQKLIHHAIPLGNWLAMP